MEARRLDFYDMVVEALDRGPVTPSTELLRTAGLLFETLSKRGDIHFSWMGARGMVEVPSVSPYRDFEPDSTCCYIILVDKFPIGEKLPQAILEAVENALPGGSA